MTTILFYDLETTGLDHKIHGIHQIGGIVEADGYLIDQFDIRMRPHHGAMIDPKALAVSNVTEADIMAYPEGNVARIADKLKPLCKGGNRIHLAGYNNARFDDDFLRAWFRCWNQSTAFRTWFWHQTIDVMVLAAYALQHHRHRLKDFKLSTVAAYLGCVRNGQAHEAMSDVWLTRDVYKKVTEMLSHPEKAS